MWLPIAVLFAVVFAVIGRDIARRKNRRVFEWGLASALVPPVVLVLLALPKRHVPN